MGEKRLPSIKIELDLNRTTKRPYRKLKSMACQFLRELSTQG